MSQSKFEIRGVIEGFYGVYYTFPERNDLIRFMGEHGYNFYIYAPKDDRQHRDKWWEAYPEDIMEQFAETVKVSQEAKVPFCYSIAPGLSIHYSSEEEFKHIISKFKAFYDIGVRDFSMLLDDIPREFSFETDRDRYTSYADAHASICNRLYAWLQELDPACTLNMCPTDYAGTAPYSAYTHELGEALHPDIDIFYTGPDICTPKIPTADAKAFAKAVKRRSIIWDNFPVNDLAMASEMHIGAIRGREANLYEGVRGIMVNIMNQPEASKIPLLTFADYFADPHNYDPVASWEKALEKIAGPKSYESLKLFAENSLKSCMRRKEAEKLERLTEKATEALKQGEPSPENPDVQVLVDYITDVDDACYHLKNRMENLALRNELLPWIELLEHWCKLTYKAVEILEAHTKGETGEAFDKSLSTLLKIKDSIERHPKRIAGYFLFSFVDEVIAQVKKF